MTRQPAGYRYSTMQSIINSKLLALAGHLSVILMVSMLHESALHAQETESRPQDGEEVAGLIAESLEDKVVTVLSRVLPRNDFDVSIVVKLNEKKLNKNLDHPYLPGGLPQRGALDLSSDALGKYIQSLTIEVLLADYFTVKTQKQVEELLITKRLLNEKRGDQVKFRKLSLDSKDNPSDLDRSLRRAEEEARTSKNTLSSLERERDDIKTELTVTKAELEKLRKSTRIDPNSFSASHRVMIGLGLLVVGGIMILGAFLRSGAKIVASSFNSIGASLPVLGDKLAEASGRGTPILNSAIDINARQITQDSAPTRGEPHTSRLPSTSLESMQSRIVALHKELTSALNESTEVFILEYLGRLLDSPTTVSRAVLTLELIGASQAKSLYGRLGPEHQLSVKEFVATGRLDGPKLELMIEVGEDLKTKLMGEFFGRVGQNTNDKVSSRIAQLRLEDLAGLTKSLKGDLLPRFLLYFEAKSLGRLLTALKQKDRDQYSKTIKALAMVPSVEQATSLDADLMLALEEHIAATKDDSQRFFVRWYKSITESLEEDLVEDVAAELALSSPRLARFIQEEIITFSTFYRLKAEIQAEIVQGFSTKDLAALMSGLQEDARRQILGFLDQRRRDTVTEEADRLAAKGARIAQESQKQAKKKILSRIFALKGQGSLFNLLATEEDTKSEERERPDDLESRQSAA